MRLEAVLRVGEEANRAQQRRWQGRRRSSRAMAEACKRRPRGHVSESSPAPRSARSAELRMCEGYVVLEAVALAGVTPTELERPDRAFLQATAAYNAARSLSERMMSACETEALPRCAGIPPPHPMD